MKKFTSEYVTNSNVLKRFIVTVAMLLTFLLILKHDRIYSIILVYLIQTIILKEMINILDIKRKQFLDMKKINWFFIIVADVHFCGIILGRMYSSSIPLIVIQYHRFFCFTSYITGLMLFIVSLERKNLKQQFACFAIAHFLIYGISLCCNFCVLNILKGKIWFVYPALLVVSNDSFAYVFGKLFGKRPLIRLSPKKTWEGYIGGLFGTLIVGMILTYIKVNYNIYEDQNDMLLLSYKVFTFYKYSLAIRRIYLHSLCFIVFASFIGPFGGFFASGLKRAFKVKDFSETIPGHGGFADRFDCQILMGLFTNVFYYTFIQKRIVSNETIFNLIQKHLNKNDIITLSQRIQNELINV